AKIYKNTVEEFNLTINSLQDNYTDLMTEKHQLQNIFNFVIQKKLELETKVSNLTIQICFSSLSFMYTFLKDVCLYGWFFVSTELKSWSDSRQYCRDHGADLIIIKSEEKQVSLVWIGLSDSENEGIMKWVDNSPLKQGFWLKGEPNDEHGNEDCIELMPSNPVLNNWNDLPCSEMRKFICEK
uniref:C-type lectin domain-containing protein n=1 Tax=Cyprinus carpio TaxID=7962 RepID=A0A8C2CGC1_CYPCA